MTMGTLLLLVRILLSCSLAWSGAQVQASWASVLKLQDIHHSQTIFFPFTQKIWDSCSPHWNSCIWASLHGDTSFCGWRDVEWLGLRWPTASAHQFSIGVVPECESPAKVALKSMLNTQINYETIQRKSSQKTRGWFCLPQLQTFWNLNYSLNTPISNSIQRIHTMERFAIATPNVSN
jgi:hypothetical protein